MSDTHTTQLLDRSPPTPDMLAQVGAVNHHWATLDAFTTAAYVAALSADPVEVGVTLGRLETLAKFQKLKTLFRYRKDSKRLAIVTDIAKDIVKLRGLRNALTHGYYIGKIETGEMFYVILPEFIIDNDFSGTEMIATTLTAIQAHVEQSLMIMA